MVLILVKLNLNNYSTCLQDLYYLSPRQTPTKVRQKLF